MNTNAITLISCSLVLVCSLQSNAQQTNSTDTGRPPVPSAIHMVAGKTCVPNDRHASVRLAGLETPSDKKAEHTDPGRAKAAVDKVELVDPTMTGDASPAATDHKLDWDISIKNNGVKPIKSVDLLIVIFDKNNNSSLHYVRKKLKVCVPPNLAVRTHCEERGLNFSTAPATDNWDCTYQIERVTTS